MAQDNPTKIRFLYGEKTGVAVSVIAGPFLGCLDNLKLYNLFGLWQKSNKYLSLMKVIPITGKAACHPSVTDSLYYLHKLFYISLLSFCLS